VTTFGTRQYGSVSFWIEGYDAAGAKVVGAEDTITLYIDNNPPILDIASVEMGAQSGGDCALFNLHGASNTPLTVRFRAVHPEGFMDSYGLNVQKGNAGSITIGGAHISGAYVHGSDLSCNSYDGTLDFTTAPTGYVQTDIAPPGVDGRWLQPDQPFCTFAIRLGCYIRVTNGYNSATASYGPIEYLLGIQAS
jgi:hypothetical protein